MKKSNLLCQIYCSFSQTHGDGGDPKRIIPRDYLEKIPQLDPPRGPSNGIPQEIPQGIPQGSPKVGISPRLTPGKVPGELAKTPIGTVGLDEVGPVGRVG